MTHLVPFSILLGSTAATFRVVRRVDRRRQAIWTKTTRAPRMIWLPAGDANAPRPAVVGRQLERAAGQPSMWTDSLESGRKRIG